MPDFEDPAARPPAPEAAGILERHEDIEDFDQIMEMEGEEHRPWGSFLRDLKLCRGGVLGSSGPRFVS